MRQILVRLLRAVRSAFHLNTVKGRVQILHSADESQQKLVSGLRRLYVRSDNSISQKEKIKLRTFSVVLLDHLDVWVVREAILADRGEVRGFPTRSVEILLDLRRHLGSRKAILWTVGIKFAMRVMYSIKDEEGGALGYVVRLRGRTKFKIIEALRLPRT